MDGRGKHQVVRKIWYLDKDINGWYDESYLKYQVVPKGGFSRVIDNIKEFKKVGGKCFLGISLNADSEHMKFT